MLSKCTMMIASCINSPMLFLNIVIVVLTLSVYDKVEAYTYEDMDALLNHLFNTSRYNRNVRPVLNQTDAVKVGWEVTYFMY